MDTRGWKRRAFADRVRNHAHRLGCEVARYGSPCVASGLGGVGDGHGPYDGSNYVAAGGTPWTSAAFLVCLVFSGAITYAAAAMTAWWLTGAVPGAEQRVLQLLSQLKARRGWSELRPEMRIEARQNRFPKLRGYPRQRCGRTRPSWVSALMIGMPRLKRGTAYCPALRHAAGA